MSEITSLRQRIATIFREKLNLVVPSDDTDLFATGGLDSLSFVELLVEIEREYGIGVSLEDLELENFRSIGRIAGFVAERLGRQGGEGEASGVAGPVDCRRRVERG